MPHMNANQPPKSVDRCVYPDQLATLLCECQALICNRGACFSLCVLYRIPAPPFGPRRRAAGSRKLRRAVTFKMFEINALQPERD